MNTAIYQTEVCSCGVPHKYHGTACGWSNASCCVDVNSNIVLPLEHPGYGKPFNDWKKSDTPLNDQYSTGWNDALMEELKYYESRGEEVSYKGYDPACNAVSWELKNIISRLKSAIK